jgi:hypothetical protein
VRDDESGLRVELACALLIIAQVALLFAWSRGHL